MTSLRENEPRPGEEAAFRLRAGLAATGRASLNAQRPTSKLRKAESWTAEAFVIPGPWRPRSTGPSSSPPRSPLLLRRISSQFSFNYGGHPDAPAFLNFPLFDRFEFHRADWMGRRRGDVRHGEWSRRDASDIDGLRREAEWSFWEKRHRRQSRGVGGKRAGDANEFQRSGSE